MRAVRAGGLFVLGIAVTIAILKLGFFRVGGSGNGHHQDVNRDREVKIFLVQEGSSCVAHGLDLHRAYRTETVIWHIVDLSCGLPDQTSVSITFHDNNGKPADDPNGKLIAKKADLTVTVRAGNDLPDSGLPRAFDYDLNVGSLTFKSMDPKLEVDP